MDDPSFWNGMRQIAVLFTFVVGFIAFIAALQFLAGPAPPRALPEPQVLPPEPEAPVEPEPVREMPRSVHVINDAVQELQDLKENFERLKTQFPNLFQDPGSTEIVRRLHQHHEQVILYRIIREKRRD